MVACNVECANLRPSEVALVLLCTYLDSAVNRLKSNTETSMSSVAGSSSSSVDMTQTPAHQILRLVEFASELQKICRVIYLFFFSIFHRNLLHLSFSNF